MPSLYIHVLFFSFAPIISIIAQELTAKLSTSRLPWARTDIAVVYDGDDSIYLIGGHLINEGVPTMSNQILKFSVLNDNLSLVSTLPIPIAGGTAGLLNQDIYHFGGYSNNGFDDSIFKYDLTTNNVTKIGQLPTATWGNIAVQSNTNISNALFLFSGTGVEQDVVKFENSTATKLEDGIPAVNGSLVRPRGAIWAGDNHALLFASATTEGGIVIKYNTELNSVDQVIRVQSPVQMFFNGGTIWDGEKAYIIGGFFFRDASSPVGILRYDSALESITLLKVKDFPGSVGNKRFSKGGVAYVKKLSRVYIFGGFTGIDYSEALEHEDIWYIDLNPQTNSTA